MVSENALGMRISGGILVEGCRSESDDVGVGGKDWGKRSKLNWLSSSPVHGAEQRCVRLDKGPECFTEVSGRRVLGS